MQLENQQAQTLCRKCDRFVPTANYLIHQARCAGPSRIGTSHRSRVQMSQSEVQEKIPCHFCSYQQSLSELDTHPQHCPHRQIQCSKCHQKFPLSLLDDHKIFCEVSLPLREVNQPRNQNIEELDVPLVQPQIIENQNHHRNRDQDLNNQARDILSYQRIPTYNARQIHIPLVRQINQPRNLDNDIIQFQYNQPRNRVENFRIPPHNARVREVIMPERRRQAPLEQPRREDQQLNQLFARINDQMLNERQQHYQNRVRINQNQNRNRIPERNRNIFFQQMARMNLLDNQIEGNRNEGNRNEGNRNEGNRNGSRNRNAMNFIQLVANRNRRNKNGKMTKAEIKKLPVHQYVQKNKQEEPELCAICYCQYEEKQKIMTLPCKHLFHPDCISQWLVKNQLCPICKQSCKKKN